MWTFCLINCLYGKNCQLSISVVVSSFLSVKRGSQFKLKRVPRAFLQVSNPIDYHQIILFRFINVQKIKAFERTFSVQKGLYANYYIKIFIYIMKELYLSLFLSVLGSLVVYRSVCSSTWLVKALRNLAPTLYMWFMLGFPLFLLGPIAAIYSNDYTVFTVLNLFLFVFFFFI